MYEKTKRYIEGARALTEIKEAQDKTTFSITSQDDELYFAAFLEEEADFKVLIRNWLQLEASSDINQETKDVLQRIFDLVSQLMAMRLEIFKKIFDLKLEMDHTKVLGVMSRLKASKQTYDPDLDTNFRKTLDGLYSDLYALKRACRTCIEDIFKNCPLVQGGVKPRKKEFH